MPVKREPKVVTTMSAGEAAIPSKISVFTIPVTNIIPNREQPRKEFDPHKLQELKSSIRAGGIRQPLGVTALGAGKYELVFGERRLRAAIELGLDSVPCIIRPVLGDKEMLVEALTENVIRDDMSELDCGRAYLRLKTMYGMTQDQIAETVGVDQSMISRAMSLAKAPEPVRELLEGGAIAPSAARHLLNASKTKPGRYVAALEAAQASPTMTAAQIQEIIEEPSLVTGVEVKAKKSADAAGEGLRRAILLVNQGLKDGFVSIVDGRVEVVRK